MLKKSVVLLLAGVVYANCVMYLYEELEQKPNSLAKDYYLYRLLEKNEFKKDEIEGLKEHIYRYAGRIKNAIEVIVPPLGYNKEYKACYEFNTQNILDANATCQLIRLNSLTFIQDLNTSVRNEMKKNILQDNPNLTKLLEAFDAKDPLNYAILNYDSANFYKIYDFTKDKKDFFLEKDFVNELAKEKEFTNFVKEIIIKKKSPLIRKSLVNVDANLSFQDNAFYLGVNAILEHDDQKALEFFQVARDTFKSRPLIDNAVFWLYLITQDKKYLDELVKSDSLNIYTLYARELKGMPLPKIEKLNPKKQKNDFDMKDPFAWQKLAKEVAKGTPEELNKLAKDFYTKDNIAIYAYIKERAENFSKHYFIMPYFEYLKAYSTQRQAMILALARQESRFIPTAISTSYALGIMQFIPFLANHIGNKELQIPNFDQDMLFEPKTAYTFANHHLDYLESKLNSPVFVAYAYNGGIGFTTRMLKRDDMFRAGKYEPFLSMELVPYAESRAYAKKVLANYIVYLHLLNDNTPISKFFETLIQNTDSQNMNKPAK
ncbi:soluble lytic murein transglycosylase [Campylobacter subantarcticus LMG 24374]|uniref:Soluble lytic murein transglycosylase n=2 Tax=Campylobacter subantarcticus TaxID=497724 RepID=A0A0A8H959_9BACT|nr:lytic transglycosylase domain-containing protein [Campylobacter subantarcticus]AJC90616.1 soluble lytic murein transglycosylase [Campylobacter subantarcticus LMG 24374]EAJ1260690.1 lytic transglycosylase domain-containing protein [Campylobacter lari]